MRKNNHKIGGIMKTIFKYFSFIVLFTAVLAAGQNKALSAIEVEIIEANLLNGLDSDNNGLKMSSAYFLGEIRSYKAVDRLASILNYGDSDELKIIAALSLAKIGSEKAIFAIKQSLKFEDNKKVSRFCEKFYNDYLVRNSDS